MVDYLASTILSGIIYDLLKAGVSTLTAGMVYERMHYIDVDCQVCQDFLDEINNKNDILSKMVLCQDLAQNKMRSSAS